MENIELLRLLTYILEQTLGDYESECRASKPKMRRLNHLEDVLKHTFIPISKDLKANHLRISASGRVNELLRAMQAGDDGEAAIARFVLRNRYKSTPVDTTVEVDGVKVKFYVSRSRAQNAANEFSTLTGEQHQPLKVSQDSYLIKNIVCGQIRDAAGEVSPEVLSKLGVRPLAS